MIGAMAMPAGFKYRDVFLRGRPVHGRLDPFALKHPPMPAGRWAKIFAPFDALRGFDLAILMQQRLYDARRDLDEGERCRLDQTLRALEEKGRPTVSVRFFVPEGDGQYGTYETAAGPLLSASSGVIRVGERRICASDVVWIGEAAASGAFSPKNVYSGENTADWPQGAEEER